jgi:hypothetical protein
MRAEDDRLARLPEILDAINAALLEVCVPNREGFIDNQDIRVHSGRDREGQPDVHPAGVHPERPIDKVADAKDEIIVLTQEKSGEQELIALDKKCGFFKRKIKFNIQQ